MTLPASGALSLSQVLTELGLPAGTQINFNDSRIRTLTGTAAGTALRFPTDFYGKSFGGSTYSNRSFSRLGYDEIGYYWVSPTSPRDTYRGYSLLIEMDISGSSISGNIDRVYLSLEGSLSQNFFSSLTLPSVGTLLTSSADVFGFYSPVTTWQWNLTPVVNVPALTTGSGSASLSFTLN
jgi:hypothetical protein